MMGQTQSQQSTTSPQKKNKDRLQTITPVTCKDLLETVVM